MTCNSNHTLPIIYYTFGLLLVAVTLFQFIEIKELSKEVEWLRKVKDSPSFHQEPSKSPKEITKGILRKLGLLGKDS